MIISNAMNQNNKLTLSRTNTVVRIPEDIVGPQVSLFANVVSTTPVATVDLWTFLLTTSYQNIVDEYRGTKDPDIRAKIKKFEIPCVTVAGVFDTRAKKRWKIQCKLPPKTKRFCPLKTFNNAPLKSLDRWGYYYFRFFSV